MLQHLFEGSIVNSVTVLLPFLCVSYYVKYKINSIKLQVLGIRFLSYVQALARTYLFLIPRNTKYCTNTRGLICTSPQNVQPEKNPRNGRMKEPCLLNKSKQALICPCIYTDPDGVQLGLKAWRLPCYTNGGRMFYILCSETETHVWGKWKQLVKSSLTM